MSALDIPCVFLISNDSRALCGTHRKGRIDEGFRLYTCGSQRAGLGPDLGVCAVLVQMQLHS